MATEFPSYGIDQHGNDKLGFLPTPAPIFTIGIVPVVNIMDPRTYQTHADPLQEDPWSVPHEDPALVPQEEEQTTVMLRNLPNDWKKDHLLETLDLLGFEGKYDFVYLPMDFHRCAGLGYAFVDLTSNEDAQALMQKMKGFTEWKVVNSAKVCKPDWAKIQGLDKNIKRFQDSPVMHPDVPEENKPMLFRNGAPVPFPAPTTTPKKPKM